MARRSGPSTTGRPAAAVQIAASSAGSTAAAARASRMARSIPWPRASQRAMPSASEAVA